MQKPQDLFLGSEHVVQHCLPLLALNREVQVPVSLTIIKVNLRHLPGHSTLLSQLQ